MAFDDLHKRIPSRVGLGSTGYWCGSESINRCELQIMNPISPSYSLSLVIPAFDEEATLAKVVQRVVALPFVSEVIIVNDCSRDKIGDMAEILTRQYPISKSKVKRTLKCLMKEGAFPLFEEG